MNDIHAINSHVPPTTLREYADRYHPQSDSGNTAILDDRVEISELAAFLSRLAELPEARARKIVDVRNAIQAGTYETVEKLDVATERLLEDLAG